jgi:hypothetical protein
MRYQDDYEFETVKSGKGKPQPTEEENFDPIFEENYGPADQK